MPVDADGDEIASEEERKTEAWQTIHQPWVLPTKEKKLAAYKELLNCDFVTLLLNAQGTREMMAQGDEYGRMIAECKTDPMALERYVYSGLACGMQAMAVLSKDLVRRRKLPKSKPETPPKSALEAKDYATKLVKAQKFAHAADMYNTAISLCQLSRGLVTVSQCRPTGDARRPVAFEVAATPRSRQIVEDEGLIHTLYANLAFCRVKQHRWGEAVGACDEAIRLQPRYGKALLRRGHAKRMLRLWKEAEADARAAIRVSSEALEAGEGDVKLHRDLIREGTALLQDVEKQVEQLATDRERHAREQNGIELMDGEPIFGRDFDHVLRRELKRRLPDPIVWIEERELHKIGMARANSVQPVDGPEFMVEASVRSRGAKRYLYYSIDIAVPWRGLMYESGKKPHWVHDNFEGIARLYGINHYTDPDQWGMYVSEKPFEPQDVPTCTPTGMPLSPMVKLRPDGSVDTTPPKRCNETQELIFQKYGPQLVKKLKARVGDSIQALRDYLGEYRVLPEAEAARRKALLHRRQQEEEEERLRFERSSAAMNALNESRLSAEQLREKHRAEEKGLDWQMPADALPLPAPTEVA